MSPRSSPIHYNGVKIHDNAEITRDSTVGASSDDPCLPGPILLQDHGSAVQFRNIWLLPLK